MPADPLAAFTEFKGAPAPTAQVVPVSGNPDFDRALQIRTTASPSSTGLDGEYQMTLGAPTGAAVNANDAMVATFWARSITPVDDSSHASFVVERDGTTFRKSANAALRFGSAWQKFTFPFRMAEGYAPGEAHVNFWLGYGAQTFQIAGLSVLDYGSGDPAGWPRATYAGRESDAAWRAAAAQRIDQYRKGDLKVNVVDAAGKPVSGASVKVEMQKQAFDFGTAVDPATMNQNTSDGQMYRQKVQDDFNEVSFGTNLQWNHWANATEKNNVTLPAMKAIRGQGKAYTRGAHLMWGSFSNGNIPPDIVALKGDPAALGQAVDSHITDEVSNLAGSVDGWNVVNEPYSEHDVTDVLGTGRTSHWFDVARLADRKADLVLNDYDLIEDNGWNTRHQNFDYNLIQKVKSDGAPIGGIGFQSHFSGLQLTPPDDLLKLFDKFGALGLPMAVTEFDVATPDEQLQADYTRDFLTLAYSVPQITGVGTWGIWEKNIWNPQVALFRADWSAKPNGQAWEDLVRNQWWTDASATTDADGSSTTRGFLGDYTVTVTANGATEKVHVSMPGNTGKTVTVVADGTSSDDTDLLGNGGAEQGPNGWYGFAPSTVKADTANPHTGDTAIRSVGRTAEWQGPAEGVQVASGQTYTSDAYVKLPSGASTVAKLQLKLTYTDGTSLTVPLAQGTVSTTGWTHVQSPTPVRVTAAKAVDHAEWWVSTSSGTADLLVDDASLRNGA
ncbi:endo-1,4-beta-xylanase [Streptomyces sp. TS71-3]|uniref:endo-1,4-beta-xylanase n=1 Tax=Streptomyces sp. TS71-3 TaxID=2733862 RepID=UPI001B1843D2|nr:endo-1,4-beta-xylanase [Streptomyces sp. TS71-3]GHJ41350.1 endo-1,4-beta-xylanase [Streptomyces sp. TS71-3]